ncbi:hypothetical protein L195_g058442, partial [Trifolium pratense]
GGVSSAASGIAECRKICTQRDNLILQARDCSFIFVLKWRDSRGVSLRDGRWRSRSVVVEGGVSGSVSPCPSKSYSQFCLLCTLVFSVLGKKE